MWAIKYGLMLERKVSKEEMKRSSYEALPVLYSLLHPLDEISPFLHRGDNGEAPTMSYMNDANQEVIDIIPEASCAVFFDETCSVIKLCKVRRSIPEETLSFLQLGMPGSMNVTPLGGVLPKMDIFGHSLCHISPVVPTSSCNVSQNISGIQNKSAKISLPQQLQMSLLGRAQSPSFLGSHCLRRNGTPLSARSTPAGASTRIMSPSYINENMEDPEPVVPNLSLDYLWTSQVKGKPKKIRLISDCMDRKFLCVLVPPCDLLCFTFKFTVNESRAVVNPECQIEAQDLVVLDKLKLMVVLDVESNLCLYNGVAPMSKIHLTGPSMFSATLFKDFSSLNISKISTPRYVKRFTLKQKGKRRSSFDMKSTSPVAKPKSSFKQNVAEDPLPISLSVIELKDPADYKFTIKYKDNSHFRIQLPVFHCSDLVEKSLAALKYVLPLDVSLKVLNHWYTKRNSPGNDNFSTTTEWNLFSKTLLSLVGYDVDKLSASGGLDYSPNTNVNKKFRATECGSQNDWDYLLASSYHQNLGTTWSEVLMLGPLETVQDLKISSPGSIDSSALLFPHMAFVLFSLHLVYEEFKARITTWSLCPLMIPCLTQLAADLQVKLYLHHYWRDFPCSTATNGPPVQMPPEEISKVLMPSYFTKDPPHLFQYLSSILEQRKVTPFPYIPEVSETSKTLILLYTTCSFDCDLSAFPYKDFLSSLRPAQQVEINSLDFSHLVSDNLNLEATTVYEKVVALTTALNMTEYQIKTLAPGLSLLLMNAQHMCRSNPPAHWSVPSYNLIQRPDIVAQREIAQQYMETIKHSSLKKCMGRNFFCVKARYRPPAKDFIHATTPETANEDDGMEAIDWELLQAIWPNDQRVQDVRKMLVSSKTLLVTIVQRPEISDHDFIEEQEKHLFSLCSRSMAQPIGRGMFTLCTYKPIITEHLHIPLLVLKGKAPPRGNTVDFPNNEMPSDFDMWPNFHNGVAGGLRIAPNCGNITSTWIVYNRSKVDNPYMHAGFLLALGLTGHLRNFSTVSLHDYLSAGHDFTCAGLLLGISAAMRGSMDMQTTKVLSVHIECLLPPTSTELDVSHPVQVSAIFGLGLLYAETGHRHMTEVLLREIGRPAGPEMENSVDRESYSLAAAFGLGLVMFGKGGEISNLSELNLEGELHNYIVGGKRKPLTGAMKEKYKSPSYQIKEGDQVNTDVTAQGATLALGMIFFRSGNRSIANWLEVPSTPYLLDQVRPDLLMLRTIARGLVMWDSVLPTFAWVEGHVPEALLENVHVGGNKCKEGIDYETIHQSYYNTLAGACFVLGLRFAGSANEQAYAVLLKYAQMFTSFTKRSISELCGKSTVESCLNITLIALSLVMAGTGDLQVLRLIRFLRSRVGVCHASVGYGSHMATHMALGFLFLGGGRFTLGTSNMAIASLIISCFPKFPAHSNDNRYHLQALRHFYVLACEPRLLMPINVDTGKFTKADVHVRFTDTKYYKDISYTSQAPFLLPELSKLDEVCFEYDKNSRHWPVKFTRGTASWHVLEALLANDQGVPLKLRYGRFPYDEMPSDTPPAVSRFTPKENFSQWTLKPSVLEEALRSPPTLMKALFGSRRDMKKLLSEPNPLSQMLAILILEYMSMGKPEIIDNWVNLLQGISRVATLNQFTTFTIWQVKLMNSMSGLLYRMEDFPGDGSLEEGMEPMEVCGQENKKKSDALPLVTREQSLSLLKRLNSIIDEWSIDCKEEIQRYLRGIDLKKTKSKKACNFSPKCAYTLVMKSIPVPEQELPQSNHPLDNLIALKERVNKASSFALATDMAMNLHRRRFRTRKIM